MSTAVASYYNYEGTVCGGWYWNGYAQGIYGVVHSYWPCGTRARFCYLSRCVVGVRDDAGPFIAGRTFDFSPTLKAALACPDLCGQYGPPLYWTRL